MTQHCCRVLTGGLLLCSMERITYESQTTARRCTMSRMRLSGPRTMCPLGVSERVEKQCARPIRANVTARAASPRLCHRSSSRVETDALAPTLLASSDAPPASPSFATTSIRLRSAAGSLVRAVRRMLYRAAAQSDTIQWCVVPAYLVGAGAGLADVLGLCIIVLTRVSRFRVRHQSLCFS